MTKVRWGVLSTAKIGTEKVIPAMQKSEFCEISALASRDINRAREVAQRLQIPKSHGSYEDLLADPDVDAIYNPLPNHLHVPLSIQALEAGKHVLCEKPIGLSSAEGQRLVDAGKRFPQLKLMEAFMYRHHSQWRQARQWVSEGRIGALRTIGCYDISSSRFIYDAEPNRVCGIVEYDASFKTDRLSSAILDFGSGTSTFTCSTQLVPYQRVNIFGTLGRVEIEIPFNAPPDQRCKMWCQTGTEIEEVTLEVCNQYTLQGDLFSQAILNNTPVPTPIEDAVANMRVMEAVVRSGASGQWEAVV